jgi:hypothetical protein
MPLEYNADGAVAVQQVAELRPIPGIDVIGELPSDLQKQIIHIPPASPPRQRMRQPRALVTFLRSETALDLAVENVRGKPQQLCRSRRGHS